MGMGMRICDLRNEDRGDRQRRTITGRREERGMNIFTHIEAHEMIPPAMVRIAKEKTGTENQLAVTTTQNTGRLVQKRIKTIEEDIIHPIYRVQTITEVNHTIETDKANTPYPTDEKHRQAIASR